MPWWRGMKASHAFNIKAALPSLTCLAWDSICADSVACATNDLYTNGIISVIAHKHKHPSANLTLYSSIVLNVFYCINQSIFEGKGKYKQPGITINSKMAMKRSMHYTGYARKPPGVDMNTALNNVLKALSSPAVNRWTLVMPHLSRFGASSDKQSRQKKPRLWNCPKTRAPIRQSTLIFFSLTWLTQRLWCRIFFVVLLRNA